MKKKLLILLVIMIYLLCTGCAKQAVDEAEADVVVGGDYPPSVFVNDALYGTASPDSYGAIPENCVYLGEVTECVGPENVPKVNFQANHASVGTKIYQYGSMILLEENGRYAPYRKEETTFLRQTARKLQVSYCDWHKDKEILLPLSDEQAEELMELLKPYESTITEDVLKSEFLKYYCIKFGDALTLTIDAEENDYGDLGASYMFVQEQGTFIKGTYLEAELMAFLAEQLAGEG